jgi:hypothetical protein
MLPLVGTLPDFLISPGLIRIKHPRGMPKRHYKPDRQVYSGRLKIKFGVGDCHHDVNPSGFEKASTRSERQWPFCLFRWQGLIICVACFVQWLPAHYLRLFPGKNEVARCRSCLRKERLKTSPANHFARQSFCSTAHRVTGILQPNPLCLF